MSLLIKALDKAEAEKAQTKGAVAKAKPSKSAKTKAVKKPAALSLEAAENKATGQSETIKAELAATATSSIKPSASNANSANTSAQATTQPKPTQSIRAPAQVRAGNVFTAKQAASTNQAAKAAIIIGLVALGVMGALAYWYQAVINAPEIVIPPRPVLSQEMPEPLPEHIVENEAAILDDSDRYGVHVNDAEASSTTMVEPALVESESEQPIAVSELVEPIAAVHAEQRAGSVFIQPAPNEVVEQEVVAPTKMLAPNKSGSDQSINIITSSEVVADLGMASESASIKMTKQPTTPGVNPVLMRAYEAYNAGNDVQAHQGYKQVLRRYGPNVDAMLGLGAIATRQERLADANGWYRKVLELEPRNEVANAGLLNLQQGQTTRPQANESNIKSMIASAPSDANLHAALGDLYADQQQWPAAQQAYFDAYRFNPSAENALNLAVSLDQLNKPALALPYYREALQKAEQSNMIDVETLTARIASIE